MLTDCDVNQKSEPIYVLLIQSDNGIKPTFSWTDRRRPSTASSVITTVPPSRPRPPQVPIRKKMGSSAPACHISLINSCSKMDREGTPIPWDTLKTGPTLYMAYLLIGFCDIILVFYVERLEM